MISHKDIIKWKHFPHYWPFVKGIHQSPMDSPHKGQWCRAPMFYLIGAWTNNSANNWDTSDLNHHCAHHVITVMFPCFSDLVTFPNSENLETQSDHTSSPSNRFKHYLWINLSSFTYLATKMKFNSNSATLGFTYLVKATGPYIPSIWHVSKEIGELNHIKAGTEPENTWSYQGFDFFCSKRPNIIFSYWKWWRCYRIASAMSNKWQVMCKIISKFLNGQWNTSHIMVIIFLADVQHHYNIMSHEDGHGPDSV